MKRYKIDFNNGKVFPAEENGLCIRVFLRKDESYNYFPHILEELGATITEIKEPIKFEFDVEWRLSKGLVAPMNYSKEFFSIEESHFLIGKRGKLTFVEHVE